MPTTTKHGYPIPESDGSDPPAGHTQIRDLAIDIDTKQPIRSKGKAINTAEQTTSYAGSTTAFTFLGTPDKVDDIVLPTDGLIFVQFRALVKYAAPAGAAEAAIFVDGNQLKEITTGNAPQVQKAAISDTDYQWISSAPNGLLGGQTGGASSTGVSTGLTGVLGLFGGLCAIEAAAGTYDIGVAFRNTVDAGGTETVTAKDRKLWVWSMEF